MRQLRICFYWFLLFTLLGTSSCTHKLTKTLTGCDATLQTCTVPIDTTTGSCVKAGQELQEVPINYTVTWTPPSSLPPQYSAQFWPLKTPFHSPNYSGAGKSSVPAGSALKATGDLECNSTTSTGCYFPYFIYKDGQKCGDPGIHIVN
jgi:hypothetical protein